jgi:LmbE family N-acetylglucosaminyl deacetylase
MYAPRILVLIPHPDDEVVGCCAAIARAKGEGCQVFGLYLSHGYLSRDTVWPWQRKGHAKRVETRLGEAAAVARLLHIRPVGWGRTRAARQIWTDLPAVKAEIDAAIERCEPEAIWVPAYEGGNPDHDALNAVASLYTERYPVYEFAEYNFESGRLHAPGLPPRPEDEKLIRLSLSASEQALKQKALKLYKSERGNLRYFLKSIEEQFRPLPRHDYTRPAHEGALWYTRHQWVPFKHPRVDFSKPEDVSKAIGTFLKT